MVAVVEPVGPTVTLPEEALLPLASIAFMESVLPFFSVIASSRQLVCT